MAKETGVDQKKLNVQNDEVRQMERLLVRMPNHTCVTFFSQISLQKMKADREVSYFNRRLQFEKQGEKLIILKQVGK